MEEKLRRAQEAYREYSTRCFWFAPEDMVVTEENLYLVVEDLRLNGGHPGWRLANEITKDSNRAASSTRATPAPDPALQFFPRVSDEAGGYREHEADAAIRAVLSAASRQYVGDFLELLRLDEKYISLGVAIWAASGRHKTFTPHWILDRLRRNSLINAASLNGLELPPYQAPVILKRDLLGCFGAAEKLVATIPPEPLGCLYLDRTGLPARGEVFDPSWTPHFGSVGGAWPKIVTD